MKKKRDFEKEKEKESDAWRGMGKDEIGSTIAYIPDKYRSEGKIADWATSLPSEKEYLPKKPSRYIPFNVRIKVWLRDGGKCTRCRAENDLEFDHIIPISKGGSNTENNIELLCKSCNRRKSDKIL